MAAVSSTSIKAWLCRFLAFMGGIFGCCTKPPIIITDEPSMGLRVQEQTVKKPNISDDFWSNNTCGNSTIQSRRSVSSVSTSRQSLGQCSAAGNVSSQQDFVNQGFVLWNQNRLQWIGSDRSRRRTSGCWKFRLRLNSTYDQLLENNKPFPHPVPLSEMVEYLVDVWEQEGLSN